ncbi:MAG TPA: MFS transporter [Pseudonocardiaceae bacterium]|jgi:MFS family permease|nr:MFS transporter [Pseudonocardiaceae bacterium]
MAAERHQTTPGVDRRTLKPWRNAVLTAFALGGITLSTWGPRLPSLRADLGVDDSVIGVVLAGVTVGSLIGLSCSTPILAWLGGRGGIRSTLWLVGLGVATIGLGAGLAHSLVSTAVGFGIVGFSVGALDVMINVEGSAVERADGRTLMPLLHAAWSAGAVVGAGVGAGCAALNISIAWQFTGEAVLIVLCGQFLARAIPTGTPIQPDQSAGRRTIGERVLEWTRGWTDWRLLLIGVIMLGVELGEGSANNWLTLAARDDHHQADAVAALFFVVFAAAETTSRVLGGPLVDRVGRVAAVRATTALGVLGMVLFIVAAPAWLVLIGTFLWAVGVSLGFPLGMSAAAESGPNPAARVSVVASIGYLANLAGPPVVGLLSQSVGLLTALWLVVALLAVAFAVSGVLRRRAV